MDPNATEVLPEAAPGPKNLPEKRRSLWWPLGLAFLVALTCLRIPQNSLNTGIDDSWGGVLVHAHEKGLQFGTDIVFTYGPLGFFSLSRFSPAVALPRMAYELLMSCGVAAGVCLLAWRMSFGWRVVFLACFLVISAPIHWGGDDLLVDVGLLSWGLLCWVESGRRLVAFVFCLAVLAAACALIKFTLLVVSSMTVGALVCAVALQGRRQLAAAFLAAFVVAFLAGWMLLGQRLSGLGPFLRNSLAIASGYNLTMGLDRYPSMGGFVVVISALMAMLIRVPVACLPGAGYIWLRRGLLLGWLTGLLFLEWKYGFLRADDDHTDCFLGFVPMLVLALAALPVAARRAAMWERAAAVVCVLLDVLFLQGVTPGFLITDCTATPKRLIRNLGALLHPAEYVREKTAASRVEQGQDLLPKSRALIGRGSVDVFGYRQMFAIYNDLNYQPRPVFQSYSVYNRPLMELNDRYYESANAPEFLLFSLVAIDGRYPPLEDAFVLRDVLFNYELAGQEGDFLVLHRRQITPIRMVPIAEGDVAPGQAISLKDYGDANLWMEISVQPTLAEKLRQLLYKPAPVLMGVWSGMPTPERRTFLAPAPMPAAGFLASPMLLDNQDVSNLFEGGALVRPAAYAVGFPPSPVSFWQSKIHYRIYRIENKLSGGVPH